MDMKPHQPLMMILVQFLSRLQLLNSRGVNPQTNPVDTLIIYKLYIIFFF